MPDYDKWKAFELEGVDSKIGNEFNSSKIMIYCNSLLINGLYNDTIGVYQFGQSGFNGDYSNQFDAVTYNNCEGPNMIHSGDIKTEYGFEHIVHVKPENFVKGFVISAPWQGGKPKQIKTLIDTNPILEIRTEDGDKLRRYIIPQDYSEASNKTICVNA